MTTKPKQGPTPGNIEPRTKQNQRGLWPCGCAVYGADLEMDWCQLHVAAPDLLAAAKLAVIELGFVAHAEIESNALTDLRRAIRKSEEEA